MTRTTTRPEQPTNRASSKVKKPIPGPGSSTVMHWRTCDSSTLAGRCPKRAPGWPPRKSRGSSAGHEGRSEDLARRTAQVLLKTTVTQAEDRLFPTGIPDSTQHPILVQRPPNPNRDHARVVIDLEDHNPLEAIRARDEDAESAVGIRLNCSDRAPWSRWSLDR